MLRPSRLALPAVTLTALLACGEAPPQAVADGPSMLSQLGESGKVKAAMPFDAKTFPAGAARVRVSIVGDRPGLPNVGIRNVFLCGDGCTMLGKGTSVAAPDDGTGAGALYTDDSMNVMTFDRIIVQPDPTKGAVVAFKTINLPKPVTLVGDGRHELFLTIREVRRGQSRHLEAEYVGAQQVPPTATSVMAYRPDRPMKSSTKGMGSLDIAAGSTLTAQVFGAQYLDTGGVTPRLSIWPRTAMTKPVTATLQVNPAKLPRGLTIADYDVRVAGRTAGKAALHGSAVTFTTTEIDDLELKTTRLVLEPAGEQPYAATPAVTTNLSALAESTSTCRTRLESVKAEMEQILAAGNSAVKTNACDDFAPYMHIVLINRADRDETLYVPVVPVTGGYELRSISQHGAGSIVAVNATAWTGDYGVFAGGKGTPDWTLYTANIRRRLSTSGVEALLGFQMQPADRSRGTSAEFFIGSPPSTVAFNTHNYNIIGTTTSIIRDNKCSRVAGTERNTWSSAGIGFNRMALLSTTSYHDTNDFEICAVYETLGLMAGAVRLDGGGAASMYWDGAHINPLTGMNYAKYGNFRYILNAMVWKR